MNIYHQTGLNLLSSYTTPLLGCNLLTLNQIQNKKILVVVALALCALVAVGYAVKRYGFSGEILNGNVTKTLPDGSVYNGQFKDGEFHGKGTLTSKNGESTYTGEFQDGKANGKGELKTPHLTYTGEFKDYQFHGEGILVQNGETYQGTFTNNNLTKGTLTKSDGEIFTVAS